MTEQEKIDNWIDKLFPEGIPDVPITIRKCRKISSAKTYAENMIKTIKNSRRGSVAQKAAINNIKELKKEL